MRGKGKEHDLKRFLMSGWSLRRIPTTCGPFSPGRYKLSQSFHFATGQRRRKRPLKRFGARSFLFAADKFRFSVSPVGGKSIRRVDEAPFLVPLLLRSLF